MTPETEPTGEHRDDAVEGTSADHAVPSTEIVSAANQGAPATTPWTLANGTSANGLVSTPIEDQGYFPSLQPVGPPLPRLIPNLGHTLLFFALAIVMLGVGQVLGVVLLEQTHLFGHRSFQALFRLSADDARLSLPVQAFSYALVAVVVIPVFGLLWHQPFGEGVHWNAAAARRRLALLALAGLAAGFGIGFFGNFLPMPKDPPIMQDMMKSPVGAWLMLAFGVSVAPLLEELAFRGFLLPGLINFFRWLARKSVMTEDAAKWIGVPVSILITSAAFAYMHSPQVSHAWGPLVLIGTVSLILCIVRLAMNSVAAGVIVHAAYNLTLFAGMLAQTGGFRHLDRLTT